MAKLCPHGPLTRVADGIFCMSGDTRSLERPRRMTVFVLPSGELAIHSGIRLADAEMEVIDSLGRVGYYLLVPNLHHDPDAAWFATRYPSACFLAPSAEVEKFRQLVRVDGTLENDWPVELAAVLEHHTVAGTRFTETAFFHLSSRTLVVVDSAFHMTEACLKGRPFGRLFMKLNNAYARFGITRLTETLVNDPAALRKSLEQILTWDFDRVIVSHGENVETDGKRLFRSGFPKYLPAVP
ncbi:MAG: hypothetical protein QM756_16620 [Polyangiaceae bacterium]